ncbi:MAG: ribosome maturation factor RimM [Alphaproteobacteria bacterium]
MDKEKRVCVGVITGAHGVKGQVKIKSFTANPEDIAAYGVLEDDSGIKKFNVRILGEGKDFLRAEIKGVSDRNEAELLRGVNLFVSREKLPETVEEEYYHTDLIGLDVFNNEGVLIGSVAAIYDFGAGDVLEIKSLDNKLNMLPFTKEIVPIVDIKNHKVVVNEIIESQE